MSTQDLLDMLKLLGERTRRLSTDLQPSSAMVTSIVVSAREAYLAMCWKHGHGTVQECISEDWSTAMPRFLPNRRRRTRMPSSPFCNDYTEAKMLKGQHYKITVHADLQGLEPLNDNV